MDPSIEIPEYEIDKVVPQEFKLPPHGQSKDEDFDPTVHLELEPEKDPNQEDGEEDFNENDDAVSYDSEGNPKRKKPKIFKLLANTLY
jgi:hypothetical protein